MHQLQVHINGVVVYQVQCRPDYSMMRGHELMKKFCVKQLSEKGIDASVFVLRDNGLVTDMIKAQIKDGTITVQSKMNDPDFVMPESEFDAALDGLPIKNEYDETN